MTLQQTIVDQFLEKLAESKDLDAAKVEQLAKLLATAKKVKPDELIKVFSQPAGGDLK